LVHKAEELITQSKLHDHREQITRSKLRERSELITVLLYSVMMFFSNQGGSIALLLFSKDRKKKL